MTILGMILQQAIGAPDTKADCARSCEFARLKILQVQRMAGSTDRAVFPLTSTREALSGYVRKYVETAGQERLLALWFPTLRLRARLFG